MYKILYMSIISTMLLGISRLIITELVTATLSYFRSANYKGINHEKLTLYVLEAFL